MRYPIVLILTLLMSTFSFAEGTREVAPNAQIQINGIDTNDIAALYIGEPRFNDFATFNNPNKTSRLHIHIKDPNSECIFLGLSAGTFNATNSTTTFLDFEYRIVDPAGNVVFGPVLITPANAHIKNWEQGWTGPSPIHGANGYTPELISSTTLTSQGWSGAGDYYVEFQGVNASAFLINYWDFTVADCAAGMQEKKGRVWSNNWAMFAVNDFGFPNRPFNGAFYVCAPDPSNPAAAFITKVDFQDSGFRPAAFNVAFNPFGTGNTGIIAEDRKSRPGINSSNPDYEIFLNDPIELCETGEAGEIDIVGVSRCDLSEFCIKFRSTKEGQIDLLLDFDGPDGIFTGGTADRIISTTIGPNEVGKAFCLDWDGKDGLGRSLPEDINTDIPIIISFAQGIYHFPVYDAELMTEGFQISAVRPSGAIPNLYYDDSEIPQPSGTAEPTVQLNGCVLPCHTWDFYDAASDSGFGNLNTINSWWFSSQVIEEAVFKMPSYQECIESEVFLCPGDSIKLSGTYQIWPMNGGGLTDLDYKWTGPAIVGSSTQDTALVREPGSYNVVKRYTNAVGDTCSVECFIQVLPGMTSVGRIDTLIVKGDTIDINGEKYSSGGRYRQFITRADLCDSILIVDVILAQSGLVYDFDDCRSYMDDSTHADYTEFEAKYPDPLTCGEIEAGFLRRDNPFVNAHSCTPGVFDSPAMCVSSLDSCAYLAGDEKSVYFELEVTPDPDTAILITGITFWERAPLMFDWISGPDGDNDPPTLYGIRILKNGVEIFRESGISTTEDWTLESFELAEDDAFLIEENATLRFELLGYCLKGTGAMVTAWDLDELNVQMACAPRTSTAPLISGQLKTMFDQYIGLKEIRMSEGPNGSFVVSETSSVNGEYAFQPLLPNGLVSFHIESPEDYANGITTRDAILLFRHLLGRQVLENERLEWAADLDENGLVEVGDLTRLRKIILGRSEDFEADSWVYDETTMHYQNEAIQHDIIAIKLGDFDGSAVIGFDGNVTRDDVVLTQDISLNSTNNSGVKINWQNDEKLSGLEFHLVVNERVTSILWNGRLLSNHFWNQEKDELIIIWDQGISIGQQELSIQLDGISSNPIILDLQKDSYLFTDEAIEEIKVIASPLSDKSTEADKTALHIWPNPSNGLFVVDNLNSLSNVIVYDVHGRKVNINTRGNQIEVLGKGIFTLTAVKDGERITQKLLVR